MTEPQAPANPPVPPTRRLSIRDQFRVLAPSQRHAFFACFLGWTLDAFDYFLLVFCIPAIAGEFHASLPAVSSAVFLTLAFRPVGALLFGAIADRFGRRPTLIANICCYSLLELACAFAPSLHVLLILRALFGIAMGGEWGVGAALVFETLPAAGRGFFSGLLQEGYSLGYLVAAAVFAALFGPLQALQVHGIPLGWRGLFALGALPALLVFYISGKVEESPTWRDREMVPASANAPRQSFVADLWRYKGTFLFLILLMAGFNAFSHGTQDLYPTFLLKDHHASPHQAGFIAIIYNIGAIIGGIFFGSLSERWGRKKTIIVATLLAIPCVPLYAYGHGLAMLALGAFLMQCMVQGAWGVVPAYLSELSPGPVRATFPGFAYQLGNLLTSRNVVLQAKAAVRWGGLAPVLAITVLVVSVYLALIASFGRESRGTALR